MHVHREMEKASSAKSQKNEEKPLFLEMSMHLCEKAHKTPKKGKILIIFLVNTLIKCEIAFVYKIPIHRAIYRYNTV